MKTRNALDERYLNDHVFHTLVDSMMCAVESMHTSFSEVRDAVLYAQIRYEMNRSPEPITFSPQLLEELHKRGVSFR